MRKLRWYIGGTGRTQKKSHGHATLQKGGRFKEIPFDNNYHRATLMTAKEISRDDLLAVLASMGVKLPNQTKLPIEELKKRVGQAFDTSQQLSQHFVKNSVDLQSFTLWSNEQTLYENFKRINFDEKESGLMSLPKQGSASAKSHIFKEMRQSILSLAAAYGQDKKEICYTANSRTCGVFVRVRIISLSCHHPYLY